jgi:hypothetical protein
MFTGSATASLSQFVNGSTYPPGTQPLGIPGLGRHGSSAEVGAGRETTGVENAGVQSGRHHYDVVFSQRPGGVDSEKGEGGEGERAYEQGINYGNNNSDEEDSLFGGGSNEESGGKEDDGSIEGNNEDVQNGANERNKIKNSEDEKEKVVDNDLSTRSSEWESEASHGPAENPFHDLPIPGTEAAEIPTTTEKMRLPSNSEEDWPNGESAEAPTTSGKTSPAIIPDHGDHEDEEDYDPANIPTTGGKGIPNVIPDDSESGGSIDEATGRRKYSGKTAAIIPDANESEAERATRPNVACKFIGLDGARLVEGEGDDHNAEVEGQEQEKQEDEIEAEAAPEPEPTSAKAKPSRKKPVKKDSAGNYVEEDAGPELKPETANTNKRKMAIMMRVSPEQEHGVEEEEDDVLPSPKKKKKKKARPKASRVQYPDDKIRCIYIKPAKGEKPAEQCGNWFHPKGSFYCHSSTHVTGPAAGGGAGGAGGMTVAAPAAQAWNWE